MIDRYGEALTADLRREYGVRLLDLFTGDLLPSEMLAYIDHLPPHSALAEAQALDEELAEEFADAERTTRAPRITEWSPEVDVGYAILDRLGEVIQAVAAAGNLKVPDFSPAPRPKTAAEKVEKRRINEQFDALVSEIEAARSLDPVASDLAADGVDDVAGLGSDGHVADFDDGVPHVDGHGD